MDASKLAGEHILKLVTRDEPALLTLRREATRTGGLPPA